METLESNGRLVSPQHIFTSTPHIFFMSGWKSFQRAADQVPHTSPISDSGAVHDGGYTKRPSMEPHVHGKTLFFHVFSLITLNCPCSHSY